jgi:DNA-binding NtrC family response regulator
VSGRVLIIDDDASACELLEVSLSRKGFDVTWRASAVEAVGNNKTLAARVLGFDRKTLYRKLERYHGNGGEAAKT